MIISVGFLLVAAVAALSDIPVPICRCRAGSPCFDNIPFKELNISVNGRLVEVPDEFDACLSTSPTPTCQAQLNRTDEQFFYTDQVGGFLHTGLAAGGGQNSWNIAHNLSAYAVAAENSQDVSAGVAFAAKHNLRLAVKGTGHDWFGRSGSHPSLEGSLLIWTHKMKNIRWEENGFVPVDCDASDAVDNAVSLQAGIQHLLAYSLTRTHTHSLTQTHTHSHTYAHSPSHTHASRYPIFRHLSSGRATWPICQWWWLHLSRCGRMHAWGMFWDFLAEIWRFCQ